MANLLVNAGRAILTNRLRAGGTEPLNIGFGSGAGTTAVTDTTLFTEANTSFGTTGTRITGTSSQATTVIANDTYSVTGSFTATAAGSVTNAGLFDNSTISSGNLFVKGDFTAIALNSGDSLTLTLKLQFA